MVDLVNPFIEGLEIKTGARSIVSASGHSLTTINPKTGEAGSIDIAHTTMCDKDSFVKVFVKNVGSAFNLRSAGFKALFVLLYAVQQKRDIDVVKLNKFTLADYFEETGNDSFDIQTLNRGIKQLIEVGFIARTRESGEFFINPAMLFNGNRFRVISTWENRDG